MLSNNMWMLRQQISAVQCLTDAVTLEARAPEMTTHAIEMRYWMRVIMALLKQLQTESCACTFRVVTSHSLTRQVVYGCQQGFFHMHVHRQRVVTGSFVNSGHEPCPAGAEPG